MKQIMEFSGIKTYNSSAFANSDDEEEDDVFSTYDFHHMRPLGSSPSRTSAIINDNSVNHNGSAKVTQEKFGAFEGTLISVIDRKIQEHADNLMHAVEGLSTRLCQLDSRKRHLENFLDELKEHVECNYKSMDGKLRQLENMLREVQGGVLDLRDKQEIAEAQLQLAMLQVSKCDPKSEKLNSSAGTHLVQKRSSSASQESHKSLLTPVTFPQPFPALPLNAPQNHPYENPELPAAAAVQHPTQVLQNQMPSFPQPECYHSPCAPTQETTYGQHHRTATQQSQPTPPGPHQSYPLAFQFPQMPQSIQQHLLHSPPSTGNPQIHPLMDHQAEGSSYISSQNYHPGIHQTYSQPLGEAPPTHQFYMSSTQKLHGQALNRPSSKFTTGYPPPSVHPSSSDYNPHTQSPFYVNSGAIPSYCMPPPFVQSGESKYPRLPTAKILPRALPTASSISAESGSSETGNRVAVDDVVDKVSSMGFRRDQVRAMVKKLTDNGQSVDLNVVLDKLMNNG